MVVLCCRVRSVLWLLLLLLLRWWWWWRLLVVVWWVMVWGRGTSHGRGGHPHRVCMGWRRHSRRGRPVRGWRGRARLARVRMEAVRLWWRYPPRVRVRVRVLGVVLWWWVVHRRGRVPVMRVWG